MNGIEKYTNNEVFDDVEYLNEVSDTIIKNYKKKYIFLFFHSLD